MEPTGSMPRFMRAVGMSSYRVCFLVDDPGVVRDENVIRESNNGAEDACWIVGAQRVGDGGQGSQRSVITDAESMIE